jgi:protein O-mannosyl-transferase
MTSDGKKQSVILLLLVGVTLAIYIPNIPVSFVDWDLVSYRRVIETTDYFHTALGLFKDWRGEIVPGYYAPLSSISLMLDKLFSGVPSAWTTIFVNLLIHCIVGILVFRLARTVGANLETAALSAAIFLIHPVQASSILWFAQRKGLMATAFYLLAYIAYLNYLKAGRATHFWASLALFVGALFSKPTVVVFPIALVFTQLLLGERSKNSGDTGDGVRDSLGRQLWRVAPFFAVSLAFGMVTMESEGLSSGENMPDLPLSERPFIAATVVWFYLAKALCPLGILPLYPPWDVDVSSLLWWFSLVSLLSVAGLLFLFRKKIAAPILWSLLNFVIPLLPVCGLLKFGYLRLSNVADHFMYLSMVGFAHLFAMSIDSLRAKLKPAAAYALSAAVCMYLLFFIIQTALVAQTWRNSVALWTYNLQSNPQSWTAHNFLGHALMNSGQPEKAIEHFRETIQLKQSFIDRQEKRSKDLEQAGASNKAHAERRKATPIIAGMYIAHHNLGNAYLLSNLLEAAAAEFHTALKLRPDYVNARVNLGIAALRMGRVSDAVKYLAGAVQESPGNFAAQYNLGLAYGAAGERTRAEEHFRKARSLRPDFPTPTSH